MIKLSTEFKHIQNDVKTSIRYQEDILEMARTVERLSNEGKLQWRRIDDVQDKVDKLDRSFDLVNERLSGIMRTCQTNQRRESDK